MLLAPVQWLVQAVALLPAALRPGVFVAVVLAIVWFVGVQRGLPRLWRLLCRALARVVNSLVALALFGEYLLTSARRDRGGAPGQLTLFAGEIAERVADGAVRLHARNAPKEQPAGKRFPWLVTLLLVAAFAIAWLVMDLSAPTEEAKQQLAAAFEYWREVEVWAGVDPTRRAAPGLPVRDPMVDVQRVHRHGRELSVLVRCLSDEVCYDELDAESPSGKVLASVPIDVKAHAAMPVRLRLPDGRTPRVRVTVYEA